MPEGKKPSGWLLDAAPFEVQRVAFDRAAGRDKYAWFLEQGLGKTLVDCADIARRVYLDQVVGQALVVPWYLKSSWRNEWAQWRMPFSLFIWPDVPPLGHRAYREPHSILFNYE